MTNEDSGPVRSTTIRERNELTVLRLIFRTGSLSQSKAVLKTGLKAPTVFRIFAQLEKRGLIHEIAAESKPDTDKRPRKGRRPVEFAVNPDAAYVVGLDFWARSASAIVQDFSGQVIASRSVCFPMAPNAESAVQVLSTLIHDMLREVRIPEEKLLGIGVGAPGSVSLATGVVHFYSRIPGMVEFPLSERLEKEFHAPVSVTNNASIVALAEERYGLAKGSGSLFAFLIRAGVGGAYLQNGRLISDRGRTAFEVGHLSMDRNGPECSCGNRGCLELYLSEDSILAALNSAFPGIDMDRIDEILTTECEKAIPLLAPLFDIASHAVRDVRRLLAPEAVLIVTRSQKLSQCIAEAAKTDFARSDQRFGPPGAKIIAAEYDSLLACKAACDLVYESYFSKGSKASAEQRNRTAARKGIQE